MKKLMLSFAGVDSWDRYVYRDQNGNLWKHVDCGSPREVCIERSDTLYSACNNEFDGEPDWPMGGDIEVVFEEPGDGTTNTDTESKTGAVPEGGVRRP